MESDNVESIATWSIYQVASFVSQLLGTEAYNKCLKEHRVNGKVLLNLKPDEWKEVGIYVLGHRHALYGWAQDRIHSHQEQISLRRRISMESSNKASIKHLEKHMEEEEPSQPLQHPNKVTNAETSVPKRSFLKENYGSQSRLLNKNMEKIRTWFVNGVGGFSKHDFLYGNIKKNPQLKAAIMETIRANKDQLYTIHLNEVPHVWSEEEIFAKVQQHRNYLKSAKYNSKEEIVVSDDDRNFLKSKEGEHNSNLAWNGGSNLVDSYKQNTEVQVVIKASNNASNDQANMRCAGQKNDQNHALKSTQLAVIMFASTTFIPEQVIQFRQERLASRGAVLEYRFFQEFDEGMIGFGTSDLLHRHLDGPYEKWELQVTDLCIGMSMHKLLLPGTHRPASTVCKGEILLLPAVYLLLEEVVLNSVESTYAHDDGNKSTTSSSKERAFMYGHQNLEVEPSSSPSLPSLMHGSNNVGLLPNVDANDQSINMSHENGLEHGKTFEIWSKGMANQQFVPLFTDNHEKQKQLEIIKDTLYEQRICHVENCMEVINQCEPSKDALTNGQHMQKKEAYSSNDEDHVHVDNNVAQNKGVLEAKHACFHSSTKEATKASDVFRHVNDEGMRCLESIGAYPSDETRGLIATLVSEYKSIDMELSMAQLDRSSNEKVQFQNEDTDVVDALEVDTLVSHAMTKDVSKVEGRAKKKKFISMNNLHMGVTPKKKIKSKLCEVSKKKVLKDITNDSLEIQGMTCKQNTGALVGMMRDRPERSVRVPSRLKD